MEALYHAVLIIVCFSVFFLTAMWVEAKVLIRQGKEPYDRAETFANILSAILYKSTDALFIVVFAGGSAVWLHAHGLKWDFVNHWESYVLIFVVQDLFFWLHHYIGHKLRFAWVWHKIHHSSTHFNFGVALRQSVLAPLPILGINFVLWAPFVLLGADVRVVAFLFEMNLFYQFWVHTRTIERLPNWIEAVFNTPSHHRVHHGYGEKQIDCNFAGVFIIWDRLFGTFVDERDAGTILYGVKTRPENSTRVSVMMFEELNDLLKTIWRTKDLRYWWHGPDWTPEPSERSKRISKAD